MRNKAWTRKELNTFLGSWTELKRDTILYAKQPMAEMGGPGVPEKTRMTEGMWNRIPTSIRGYPACSAK